jgi:hypothetical protein
LAGNLIPDLVRNRHCGDVFGLDPPNEHYYKAHPDSQEERKDDDGADEPLYFISRGVDWDCGVIVLSSS